MRDDGSRHAMRGSWNPSASGMLEPTYGAVTVSVQYESGLWRNYKQLDADWPCRRRRM